MSEQDEATANWESPSSIRVIRIMPPKEDFGKLPISEEAKDIARELYEECRTEGAD